MTVQEAPAGAAQVEARMDASDDLQAAARTFRDCGLDREAEKLERRAADWRS